MSAPVATRKATLVELEGLPVTARRAMRWLRRALLARGGPRRLVFAGVLASLLFAGLGTVAEIHLRRLAALEGPGRVAPHQERALDPTGTVVRSLRPGLSWVRRPGDGPDALPLNAWGFHDGEIEIPKPTGTYRIVLVGDSMTFGRAVGRPELTYAGRLETRLAERAAGGLRFDVVNLALEGYQAVQSLAMLRHVAFAELEPDLVIYAFYVNDLIDTRLDFYLHRDRFGDCTEERGIPSALRLAVGSPTARLRAWVKTRSSLYEEGKHRLAVLRIERVLPAVDRLEASLPRPGANVLRWVRGAVPALEAVRPRCDEPLLAAAAIRGMARLTRANDTPFLILRIPQFEQLGDGEAGGARFLHRVARWLPDALLYDPEPDLEDELRRAGLDRSVLGVSAWDQHPSVYGHTVLSELLLRALVPMLAEDGAWSGEVPQPGPSAPIATIAKPVPRKLAAASAAFARKARGARTRSAPVTRQAPKAAVNMAGKATSPSENETTAIVAAPSRSEARRARFPLPPADSYSRPSRSSIASVPGRPDPTAPAIDPSAPA